MLLLNNSGTNIHRTKYYTNSKNLKNVEKC